MFHRKAKNEAKGVTKGKLSPQQDEVLTKGKQVNESSTDKELDKLRGEAFSR